MSLLYVPLITPFQEDESLDIEALHHNLAHFEDKEIDGYLINGSSGEAEMLSIEERLTVLKEVLKVSKKQVIAGIVAHSTHDCLKQMEALQDMTLEAVMIRTPSYYGRQHDQVDFFQLVASESPHPVMIYQIPQYTGVRLNEEVLWELSHHPNISGIKDSLGDLALLAECEWPGDFKYFLGASHLLRAGMELGSAGGILALANVVPSLCRRLLDCCDDPGRKAEALEMQRKLIPLNRLLGGSRGYGLAGLKLACGLTGMKAGIPRKPLKPICSEGKKELLAALFSLLEED